MKNKTAILSKIFQPFLRLFVRLLLLFPKPLFLAFLKFIRRVFSRSFNELFFDDCFARCLRQGYASVPVRECSLEITIPLDVSLDVGDYIQRSFYLFGYPHFTAELLRFCDHKTAFFDIGANLGLITLAVAQSAPANYLFAFEPEPGNFLKLQAILLKNCNGARAVQLGLSDTQGKMELKSMGNDSGSASFEIAYLDSRNLANQYHSESAVTTVEVTTFDSFVKTIDLSDRAKVAMKIDVEGHELSVLRGMRQFFKDATQLICIVVETHKRNYDGVHELLSTDGFTMTWPAKAEIEAFQSGDFSAIDLIYVRQ